MMLTDLHPHHHHHHQAASGFAAAAAVAAAQNGATSHLPDKTVSLKILIFKNINKMLKKHSLV